MEKIEKVNILKMYSSNFDEYLAGYHAYIFGKLSYMRDFRESYSQIRVATDMG